MSQGLRARPERGAPFDLNQFECCQSIGVNVAVCLAIKALGANEPPYRALMRIAIHNGDRAAVIKAYDELCHRLAVRRGRAFGRSRLWSAKASQGARGTFWCLAIGNVLPLIVGPRTRMDSDVLFMGGRLPSNSTKLRRALLGCIPRGVGNVHHGK